MAKKTKEKHSIQHIHYSRLSSISDKERYCGFENKELKDFHREGTKLMKKLSKIMDREEKSDPYSSVFVMRAAESMVVDWLNEINPHVKYGIINN